MPNLIYGGARRGDWWTGTGVPLSLLGNDGDLYLDLDAGESYIKEAGVWATQDLQPGGGGGGSSPLTTKGDIWGFSTVDARIPIGANGYTIIADSAQALGLRWVSSARLEVVATAYAATVTLDLSLYPAADIVVHNVAALTGPITYNITGGFDGQVVRTRFRQDATGSRVYTGGANIRYSATTPAPLLSVGPLALDRFGFEWCSADSKADLVALNKTY